MRTIKVLSVVIFSASLLLGIASAWAQGTSLGTIRGTVTDPNGAVLPNVAVKITDETTGISRDLTTSETGEYEAAGLKYGTYKVSVTAPGFKTHLINVVLNSSETVRANAELQVGEASSTVDVSSETAVIQTESPTVANTITNRQLIEIPRDSRDIYEFLYLDPNITQG